MAEEERDREDHQEDLGEHEDDDADPEADPDLLFESQVFHRSEPYRERPAEGRGATYDAAIATVSDKQVDLRTRARAHARAEVAEIAFRVFAERGFDAVTATEVAEAAGISRASFFRYFESKEEAVFVAQEEMGANIAAALAHRPAGEDAWSALRRALDPILSTYQRSPAEALDRLRLIRCTPALRAHQLERLAQWKALIGAALAGRLGMKETDVRVEALVGAALGALDAASSRWAESEGSEELIGLIDGAFAVIAEPFPTLSA